MPRVLSSGFVGEITAARLAPCLFFEGQFATGPLRMWSGIGNVAWNGVTWMGSQKGASGNEQPIVAAISTMAETVALAAGGITVSLSGLPASFVDAGSGVTRSIPEMILAECRQSYSCTVWFGVQNLDTGAIIADPYKAFSGRMDVPQIADAGDSCGVSISIETRFIDLQRPRVRRYTHEDQQVDHAGDLGFEYVTQLQQLDLIWGKATAIASPRAGSPMGPLALPSRSTF